MGDAALIPFGLSPLRQMLPGLQLKVIYQEKVAPLTLLNRVCS